MDYSVGIGCTTFNRPECKAKWIEQVLKHTTHKKLHIYIAEDTDEDRRGVAARKNECLRALKDCDYIFLFDDDCYPIHDNWIEFFVNNAAENHVMFLNDKLHNFSHQTNNVRFYNDCGGVFLYIPKFALNKVGAFDEKFELWGMEHCDWSVRYAGKKIFMMIEGTDKYIYSLDYSDPNHKSSITNEEKEILFKKNYPKFLKEINSAHIPL